MAADRRRSEDSRGGELPASVTKYLLTEVVVIVDMRRLVYCLMFASVRYVVPSITDTWRVLHALHQSLEDETLAANAGRNRDIHNVL